MPDNTSKSTTPERVEDALKTARRLLRRTKKAKKALDSVRHQEPTPATVADFLASRGVIERLAGDTGSETLDTQLHGWLDAVAPELAEASAARRHHLLNTIEERAASQSMRFEKLADSPPTYSFGPFRLALPTEDVLSISLGREPIAEVEPDCDAVFEACDAAQMLWEERTPEPGVLFERLLFAYRAACALEDKSPGDRIAIVDLLGPLALLETPAKRLRGRGLDAVDEYPRHLLARQLAELSRQQHLEHRGTRLELGAATGGSTSQKQDVLYVCTGPGRGQYYLSVRFVRQ